jgi:hypothetical protein
MDERRDPSYSSNQWLIPSVENANLAKSQFRARMAF